MAGGVYVLIYLVAIVAANLGVARFGPAFAPFIAFLLIGLDLSLRDRLHDLWRGRLLWFKMAALICAGSAITYLINQAAGRIALASVVAFALAMAADAMAYHSLRRRPFLVRANGSNLPSAFVDSLVFPTLAFGAFMPLIVLGQFAAKVGGGALWSLVIQWLTGRRLTLTG